MSSLKIEEHFSLSAPPSLVWDYLTQPERVVDCLPGASIVSRESDLLVHGRIKVKVGAVTVAYKGTVSFVELDRDALRMRMSAKGREAAGGGSASMEMVGSVVKTADGGSDVTFDADVRLAGKIVRFGRGMIEGISQELFRQFTVCLAKKLEAAQAAGAGESGGPPDWSGATVDEPRTLQFDPATVVQEPASGGAEGQDEDQALDALGLFFRVLGRRLRSLFRRLTGRS